MKRFLAALVAMLVAASPVAAQERTNLADVEDEVMCPICGTTLELSESPQADRQREFIRTLVAEGRTKEEVKRALVAEYGDEVLAVPSGEGFDLAAWLVPVFAIGLAAIAIGVGLRRWRRAPRGPDGEPPTPLSRPQEERLSADLARYEP